MKYTKVDVVKYQVGGVLSVCGMCVVYGGWCVCVVCECVLCVCAIVCVRVCVCGACASEPVLFRLCSHRIAGTGTFQVVCVKFLMEVGCIFMTLGSHGLL